MLSAPPSKSEIMKEIKKAKIPLPEKTRLSICTLNYWTKNLYYLK